MNPLLKKKIIENTERRQREGLLEQLPPPVAAIMAEADYLYSEPFFTDFPLRPGCRFDENTTDRVADLAISHHDFDDIDHVKEYLRENPEIFQPPV